MKPTLTKIRKAIPKPLRQFIKNLFAFRYLGRRPRGYRDYMQSMISDQIHSPRAWGNPVSITIEPVNVCNLRCPVCETGAGILGRRPEMMSYENYVKIMDKVGPAANTMIFYFMGEPFLNKDAYRMIRYARNTDIYVDTCTNGEPIDPEALYESGINHISFQIGGITQETHEIYRVRGNLGKTLGVLERYLNIIRKKGRKPSEHQVELGFILMKHNEHEIGDFYRKAKELGVDQATVISPCVRTVEQGECFLPTSDEFWLYDREVFEKNHQLVPKYFFTPNSCPWIYYTMTIQVNGDVVACCRDPRGTMIMGNLIEQPLEEVWNGKPFQELRRMIARDQSRVNLCQLCGGYGQPALH